MSVCLVLQAMLQCGLLVLQASVQLLCENLKVTESEALDLISLSATVATQARAKFLDNNSGADSPLIAGSVGAYGACLHDSSEYTGEYVDHVSREEMKEWHRPRIAALLSAKVDLLAIETIPAQVSPSNSHAGRGEGEGRG